MGPVADRVFVFFVLGGLAAWVAWGWRSWARRGPEALSIGMWCSLVGFTFASASAAVDIVSGTYAQFIDGFPFEDPTLLRIYRWGFLLAFVGLIGGLFGMGKKSPLRWKAPMLSLVLLLLWIAAVMGE